MNKTTIVYGKFILAGSNTEKKILKDGAIHIRDGVIEDIGKSKTLRNEYNKDEIIGSGNCIIIPGLINSHHHGRGLSQLQMGIKDAPLEVWISYHLGDTYEVDVYKNTLLSCIKQIKCGITTSLHHFYVHDPLESAEYSNDVESIIKAHLDSGMRASLAPAIQNQNKYVYLHEEKFLSSLPQKTIKALQLKQFSETENRKRIENYFRIFKKTQETHKKNNRVKLLLGPTGVQWCTDELLKRIKKESDKMGIGIHMHLQESMYQRDYGYKLYEKSPLQHLKDIEFIGPEVSFAHGVWLSEEDMRLISDSGASVVHNPSSNLRLFNGVAPIPEMIKNNVKVSLGIDGTGINDDDDILQEMRLCSVIHRKPGIKQYELFSKTLTAPKIFDMATKQGAQTTGYGSEIGSIEIGKKADLVLINSKRIEPLIFPGTCLEDLILNWVKSEDISSVMVDGKLLMHERKMIGLDEETIFNDLTAERREQEREVKNQLQKYKEYLKNYYKNW